VYYWGDLRYMWSGKQSTLLGGWQAGQQDFRNIMTLHVHVNMTPLVTVLSVAIVHTSPLMNWHDITLDSSSTYSTEAANKRDRASIHAVRRIGYQQPPTHSRDAQSVSKSLYIGHGCQYWFTRAVHAGCLTSH
jgi:hypothetical protein